MKSYFMAEMVELNDLCDVWLMNKWSDIDYC